MTQMLQFTKEALEQMPPETRFRPEDATVIARNKEILLSWSEDLVKAFYDTLFAHPPTKKIFRDGERPEREHTLRAWWQRTVEGPLNEEYFAWMAKVGLAHVVRGVENPMMLSMSSFVAKFVEAKAQAANLADALVLSDAFYRLAMAVGAVIAYGYDRYRALALYNVAGMEPALLERLTVEEAKSLLEAIRKEE